MIVTAQWYGAMHKLSYVPSDVMLTVSEGSALETSSKALFPSIRKRLRYRLRVVVDVRYDDSLRQGADGFLERDGNANHMGRLRPHKVATTRGCALRIAEVAVAVLVREHRIRHRPGASQAAGYGECSVATNNDTRGRSDLWGRQIRKRRVVFDDKGLDHHRVQLGKNNTRHIRHPADIEAKTHQGEGRKFDGQNSSCIEKGQYITGMEKAGIIDVHSRIHLA